MIPFCEFCPCGDCKSGRADLRHARTSDGRWICNVCWRYEVCIKAKGARAGGPCDDLSCDHRPKLAGEWISL